MALHSTLIELFPSDIINIILPYAGHALIIDMQDYYPMLLKNIVINSDTINKVNQKDL